jgi:hypothetical protein
MSRRKNKPQQPANAAEPETMRVEVDGVEASAASLIASAGDALETMAAEAIDDAQLPETTVETPEQPPAPSPVEKRDESNVKPHLRCPCCWNGRKGKAFKRKWQRQVNGPLVQRCYVCDQCGTEWVVDVRVEEIDGVAWVETKTAKVRPGATRPGDAA